MSGSSPPSTPTSPNTCEVLGLLKNGGAFSSELLGLGNSVKASLTSTISSLSSTAGQLSSSVEGAAQAAGSAIQGIISTLSNVVSSAIDALMGHIQQQIASMVRYLTIAMSDLANNLGLSDAGCAPSNAPPPSDPCAGMSDFFGLIMGAGRNLLNSIGSKLSGLVSGTGGILSDITNGITSGISAAMGAINGLMSGITGAVSEITSSIASEASRLANAILDNLALGNVFALNNLFKNPCARGVLNAVGTPQLLSALSR